MQYSNPKYTNPSSVMQPVSSIEPRSFSMELLSVRVCDGEAGAHVDTMAGREQEDQKRKPSPPGKGCKTHFDAESLLGGKLKLLPYFDEVGILQDAFVEIEYLHVTLCVTKMSLREL